ncbi:hypothetical protein ACVOMV_34510 [Mesorhizobium atlanticum]
MADAAGRAGGCRPLRHRRRPLEAAAGGDRQAQAAGAHVIEADHQRLGPALVERIQLREENLL